MAKARRSQNEKILTFLSKGKQLTVREARSRFGVQNLRARINELRDHGFRIYTNQKTVRGQKVTAYRLDNSDQELIRNDYYL